MGSFDVEQGGINSGPGSYGILDGMWTDGLLSTGIQTQQGLESTPMGFFDVGQRDR